MATKGLFWPIICFFGHKMCKKDFQSGYLLDLALSQPKDMGGSQRDNDFSPNLLFNPLKQKEIELKEGSARVL